VTLRRHFGHLLATSVGEDGRQGGRYRMAWLARVLLLAPAGVFALLWFRPTPDTVGPLTAKIEGPEKIERIDTPLQYSVVLENGGDAEIEGAVRVRGIDRWRVEPAEAAPFSLAARASTCLGFTVTPAERTFNAHYPIHAFAEFDWQGRRQQAHAVLTVLVRAPNPPAPQLPAGLSPPPAAAPRAGGAGPAPAIAPQGSPRLSEAGADQYIGWLDGGAGAHMRAEGGPARSNVWRIENSDTERVPWFDIAYHDVFVLQGAGYPGRYNSGQDARLHGMYSDDYITTEVMTGHPGMVWDAFTRDTVRKYWLLHDLMRGPALRRMDRFAFAGGNLHRQQVRWDNGGLVWVNRGAENWTVEGHDLPQYGFYARVPSAGGAIEAAIERREGLIVEWASSPALLYANARPVTPDPQPARGQIACEAGIFAYRFR